jgi:catechol 2,3-dioxygenase-like lactoylglutathione lyase family enzyme
MRRSTAAFGARDRDRDLAGAAMARGYRAADAVHTIAEAPYDGPVRIVGIDHVQISIPAGAEPEARRFYAGVLGLTEVPKPASLAARGGCWFSGAGIDLHLGVEADFRPAARAHAALVVDDLPALRAALLASGSPVVEDDADIGVERCYTADPFGNRIELVAASDRGFSTGRDWA